MRKVLLLLVCVLLLSVQAEARYLRHFSHTAITSKKAKGKGKSKRGRKRAGKRIQPRGQSAADWDDVMRRNTSPALPAAEMLPEEYSQWLKNLNDQELDLYLRFRLTDAVPLSEIEAEAKRRGIR